MSKILDQAIEACCGCLDRLEEITLHRVETSRHIIQQQIHILESGRQGLAQLLRKDRDPLCFRLDETHICFRQLVLQPGNLFQSRS